MTSSGTLYMAVPLPSRCAVYDHRYEGPIPGYNFNDFSIYAVFDARSRRYFSGIQVVVVCKAGVVELETLNVRESHSSESPIEPSMSSASRNKGDQLPNEPNEKPLCTLVYEIFDDSDADLDKIDISFCPDAHFDDPHLRTLYTHIERNPKSPVTTSVTLFLSCSESFRGNLKPSSDIDCDYPAPTGIVALGARVLPPPSTRSPFKQPPPEILSLIFRALLDDDGMCELWRATLISLGLVCRAWSPALALLYEDFSQFSSGRTPPDMMAVAQVLERQPHHGQAIRRFSPRHFSECSPGPASSYEQQSRAFVQILQKAPLVTDLAVTNVHAEHVDSLKRALCECTAVREFLINQQPSFEDWEEHSGKLCMADVVECVSHWPRLKRLRVFGLSETGEHLNSGFLGQCCCRRRTAHSDPGEMHLQTGRIMDHELLRLASFIAPQFVTLYSISGLTNAGLRKWLEAAGPSLRTLRLTDTALTRETDDEEWALDAAITQLPELYSLNLEEAIFSELVFARRERRRAAAPPPARRTFSEITVRNIPAGMFGAHFLTVLKYTGWRGIHMWGAFRHDAALREQAKKVAREHGVQLNV